jgi:hypothetical protein
MCAGIERNPGPSNCNSHMSSISIVHNNVCSLKSKVDIIAAELSGYDIIGISETHLDKTISSVDIVIPGYYSPIQKDRKRHGGGVAVYVSSKMSYVKRDHLLFLDLEIV